MGFDQGFVFPGEEIDTEVTGAETSVARSGGATAGARVGTSAVVGGESSDQAASVSVSIEITTP